jgi:lariat debranching enzyme
MESKIESSEDRTINIIVTGCIHGCMDKMYKDIQEFEKQNKKKIDLVLCTGDFESIRNEEDLKFLSCPEHYRLMGDFHKYYDSKVKAPYLTIFIGGNHEASNYLEQIYYGGYVAENIYYLGRGGVINVKGLRIGGISGIFNKFDYFRGHFEKNENDIKGDKKSIFHYREFEIAKMSHIKNKLDIFMTHDWPTNIIDSKDFNRIFKLYPQNKETILAGTLGSFPAEFILKLLKPNYYICGHMHFYYTNIINKTKIYAFDKCVKKRHYFDLIEVKPSMKEFDIEDNNIYIDPEWMAITNALNEFFPNENKNYSLLDLFEENSKLLYNNIVLDKMKIDRRSFVDVIDEKSILENKINDLILKKFNKREKVKYEINHQTEILLPIFDIAKDNNKHYLSSKYLD